MKIFYLANIRFPSERAHAVQIVQMCNSFASLENEVALWVTDRNSKITDQPEEYFGTTFRFAYGRIHVWDFVRYVNILPQFLRKFIYQFERIQFAFNSIFKIRESNPEVIYCRDEWVVFYLSFIFPVELLVYESHEARYDYAARHILKKGVRCVCISEGIFNFYQKNGIPEEQMIVAHDGIDDSFFLEHINKEDIQKELNINGEKPVVMYIGGFDSWKGIEVFLQTSDLLPDVQFIAIGGNLSQIEYYKNVYKNAVFLGERPYKDLVKNQQAADILVIPNTLQNDVSAKYTSPLKLFAHMTSKVPMIVSDIESLRNVLSEKEAFFFKPGEPESLKSIIQTVVNERAESESRAQSAYGLSAHYTWNVRAQRIIHFLHNGIVEKS